MTPTSSSSAAGRHARLVSVPAPAARQALSVDMVPGSEVRLPFNPEETTVSRSDNSLIFELDNGGTVTVTDFFVTESGGQLPMLLLPGGEEVPAALAFADAGFDLSTAAGPNANPNAQGSGTTYTDDSGSLIGGLDKLGKLGTDYWARAVEAVETLQEPERPGGSFDFHDRSDLGGLIGVVGAVFEDGLPYQHQGDFATLVPGQLVFTFEPTGTTVVDAIHISGFPAGTVIYLGDPNDPATQTITITGPDQVLDLTQQDFDDGLFFIPPKDSDTDFTLDIEIDIHAESSGISDTISGSTEVIVDAVADKPEFGGADATADSSGHQINDKAEGYEYDRGVNRSENSAQEGTATGKATVSVTVRATFGDYTDGSEKHYIVVEAHEHLKLDPNSLPPGYTYVGTIVIDGVEYHQFQVDNDLIAENGGTIELPLTFDTTDDAGDKTGEDETYDMKAGAYAEEEAGDKEIDLDNNTAHVISDEAGSPSATVDVINRGSEVEVGWASEGNNNAKHKPGAYTPDFENMDEGDGVDAGSTDPDGAPIGIRLTGNADGTQEFITEVELKFEGGAPGKLCVNGEPVTDGFVYSEDGVTYTFHIDADGTISITIDGKTDNLDDLDLTFKPDPGYDDSDVDMSYKIKVENEAGAEAEFSGDTEIVIDAVADRAIGGNGTADHGAHDDGSARNAAAPGDTVSLTFKVGFPDTDGSEDHRFFIRVDGNKGSATHEYGDNVIDANRIAELNGMGAGLDPNGDYLELPIPHPSLFGADGTYTDPETGLVIHYENGVYTYEGLDITVTDNGNGDYTVENVEVTLPDEATLTDGDKANGELDPNTGDTSMDFDTKSWSHEKGGEKGSSDKNNEHDGKNNDAFIDGKATVDINTPGGDKDDFQVGGDTAFENDQPHNHIPGSDAQHTDTDGNDVTPDGGAAVSLTWNFADNNEVVTEITIKVPLDRYGNPVGEIEYRHEDGTVTTYKADADGNIRIPVDPEDGKNGFDDGDLTFLPKGNASGEVELEISATVKDTDSGETKTVDLDDTVDIAVDAVANRSGAVTGEGDYGEGRSAFAAKEGESLSFKLKTTFDDNDGSEQHFLLVEQKPHWGSQFESGRYDLDGDGDSTSYFKIPVPTMPPEGAGADYPGSAHHLSAAEWEALKSGGVVVAQRDGYSVTIKLQQAVDENGNPMTDDNGDPIYDPSLPWDVEAEISLDPPYLPENDPGEPHSMGTGSLAEEWDIDQNTENRGENNNSAMRPGEDLTFNVDRTAGISIGADTGFLYENNEQYEGPAYKDKDGNVIDQDYEQSGAISVTPSSAADSFYGELEVSIEAGHGDLYYENADGDMILLEPGGEYAHTTKDGVSGKLAVTEEGGRLTVTFTPDDPSAEYKGIDLEIRLDGDYSDKDIDIDAKGNLINDNSGQKTEGVEGKDTTMVDAVAQAPDKVESEVAPGTDANTRDGEGAKVTLSTHFEDVEENSEGHYFLLEAKPGFAYTFTDAEGNTHTIDVTADWPTVVGPDGKTYFKVPADPDADGNATLDLEITVPEGGEEAARKNGDADNATFKYGAMTEEERLSDSGEKTYDNNVDFNTDNEFTIDVDIDDDTGGLHPIDADVAYENNTPDAHLGGDEAEAKEYAELTFDLPEDADGIRVKPGDRGSLVDENGNPIPGLEPDADGWYHIPKEMAEKGGIHIKVDEDYSDEDIPLDWEIDGGTHDGESGTIDIVTDAVAQQGKVDEASIRTADGPDGAPYTHAAGGDITLDVAFSNLVDPHHGDGEGGHTDYFALVEAQPGWECKNLGAELVVIDGKSYFRIPIDSDKIRPDGTADMEIILDNPGGNGTRDLDIGIMTRDRPGDNGEIDMDNNTSININGEVEIKTSVAEPTLTLTVSDGYEDNIGGYASIDVSGLTGNDEVTDMHFSVDAGEGVFTYDGLPLEEGILVDGNVTITVTMEGDTMKVDITPTPPATGLTEEDLAAVSDKFGLGTADDNHSSKDIDIDWNYGVRDTDSGDTAQGGGEKKAVIDAVAHQPEVTEYTVDYGPGKTAAQPGDTVIISATVAFTHLEAETDHVLVQFTPGWEVNGITLTGPDGTRIHYSAEELKAMDLFYPDGNSEGGSYFKLPLEKDGVTIEPGVGEGETYDVDVDVDATVPTSGIDGDTKESLGIGGVAEDSYEDGESLLANNTASDTDGGDGIHIGIADSTHIDGEQIGDAPEEGAGNVITFDIRPEGGQNDVITDLTLINNHPDPESTGHFYYDGQKLEYDADGKVHLPPSWLTDEEKANWTFDNEKLDFRPENTFGGTLDIDIDASVKDAGSGDAKDGLKGDMTIDVTPVATAPTMLEAQSQFSESDGGVWTLTLSAAFADIDGSESHFFAFKIPDGLVLDGSHPGLEGPMPGPDGTDGWYKLPVDSTNPNPEVDLSFRADSSWDGASGVEFNAGATETATGETDWAIPSGGEEATPADDGAFAHRMEEVDGARDFSGVSDDLLVHGGGGDDTIVGGQGDDTLSGGAGNDVIHATAGSNLIIGGAGNDTLYGGEGEDVFFWDAAHFGSTVSAHDVVWDFEYGKDMLQFGDVFGDEMDVSVDGILDLLNNDKGGFTDNSLSLEGDSFSLTAQFTEDGVSLHINKDGAEQTIDVNFDGEGAYTPPMSAEQAAEILNGLIGNGLV